MLHTVTKQLQLEARAMISEKLVFDRTQQDVTYRTSKGLYNVSDIARINSYIEYLANNLNLDLTIITPNLGEALTLSKIQTIINNVNEIRDKWYVATDTPTTPVATNWDYVKANNIEKILQALYEFMVSVKNDKLYSGTFRAGSHIKFRAIQTNKSANLLTSDSEILTTVDGKTITVEV